MPELPEVQTTVDGLNKKIVGRKVVNVWIDWKKLVKHPSYEKFKKEIIGRKFLKGNRRAKYIVLPMSDNKTLLIHQKMSGHMLYGVWEEKEKGKWVGVKPEEMKNDPKNRFIRLVFLLDNGSMLALSDLRRFAKVLFVNSDEVEDLKEIKTLGPEPLEKEFTVKKLKEILSRKKGRMKTLLMDPKVIVGIGNIYSDEILWEAGVHPLRSASTLTDDEIKKIHKYIKSILKKAVDLGGTSVDDYRAPSGKKGSYQEVTKAYQKTGNECVKKDGGTIERLKIGGRSAHFCSKHQS